MKTCSHCKQTKPLDEFYAHPDTRDKKQSWCKVCAFESTRVWIKTHPEANRAKAIRWQKKMKALGRCVTCGKKTVNGWYCEKHREYYLKLD